MRSTIANTIYYVLNCVLDKITIAPIGNALK